MRAWTIDADDIAVADDFDDTLVQRTPAIDEFLDASASDRFIVSGTKGFGKTLLLKAKRVLLQGKLACIPSNVLLDKPIGETVFSADMIKLLAEGPAVWRQLWLFAISLTVLKHSERMDDVQMTSGLQSISDDPHLHGVIDHFVRLLELPREDTFAAGQVVTSQLVPRLRGIRSPVAVFIDSIDEYFSKHIQVSRPSSSVVGEVSADIWYFAQLGLIEASYQLRRINHHVKVFATVRKEALARLYDDPMVQQYLGSIVDLTYAKPHLHEIFCKNIRRERRRNLASPARLAKDPVEAFTGLRCLTHSFTGESETTFDYIYRHTLMRPRDLMTIGRRIGQLPAEERTNEVVFKATVNAAATEIAREYLAEITPYVGDVHFAQLFGLLPRHVLTRDELEVIAQKYDAARTVEQGYAPVPAGKDVLDLLYRAGLLGYVTAYLVATEPVQKFLAPGEAMLDSDRGMPAAPRYLLHPVLAEIVDGYNPGYMPAADRVNIVGDGRPWRDQPLAHVRIRARDAYVLRADIHGFADIMRDPAAERSVRRQLQTSIEQHAGDLLAAEIAEGDSITIVHDSAKALLLAGVRIMHDLLLSVTPARLRMAVTRGAVQLERCEDGHECVAGGDAVLLASRIEPHVGVGEIWVTEDVSSSLADQGLGDRLTQLVPPAELRTAETVDTFNVKKPGSCESDRQVRLMRISVS